MMVYIFHSSFYFDVLMVSHETQMRESKRICLVGYWYRYQQDINVKILDILLLKNMFFHTASVIINEFYVSLLCK
jgi:hypothetical protein